MLEHPKNVRAMAKKQATSTKKKKKRKKKEKDRKTKKTKKERFCHFAFQKLAM